MYKNYEVLVAVEIKNLKNKSLFDKHLKKEGLKEIEGEEFVYQGYASTSIFNTKAFVQDAIKKALKKGENFQECKMILWLGDNPPESFKFDISNNEFIKAR